jgi:cobalt-zinc-cadmium efflux system protein
VLGDLLGSVAAIVAAGVILWTGWTPIDPLLSIAVALLVLRSAWFITRQSAHILMEGTPHHIDPGAIRQYLIEHLDEVEDVHHIHIWSLTQERPLITLHARICPTADSDQQLKLINAALAERFQVAHATVQLEKFECSHPSAGESSQPGRGTLPLPGDV